ncbi:MAG: tauK [Devosia sp.]|uniref:TRAP transporter substrate-binding protein n=1 Tax=Devosia sp. TaxID=1871048 RepID=UPI002611F548|nr:TRAP transporter substrate-binding protein [Devosia sp.]MDB5541224.1 tauK [Devosia sp.]
MNRLLVKIALSFIVALAAGLSPAAAQTLRLAHHQAVGSAVDLTANKFAEIVHERSKGTMTIKVFPAAQLGQEREAFGLCNTGVLDLCIASLGVIDQAYPAIAVTSLPFVFRDWDHVYKAYDGNFGAALREGMSTQTRTQVLGYVHLGFRDMLFRGEPVRIASGMKGVKMRSPEAAVWFHMFEALGARPTPVTWGEVYSAMQTGIADGLEAPPMTVLDNKLNEVVKSIVRTQHMFASLAILGSSTRLGRLTKAQQELLLAAGQEAAKWSNTTISQPGEKEAYKRMATLGMNVSDPVRIDEWSKPMQPVWKDLTSKTAGTDRLLKLILETK